MSSQIKLVELAANKKKIILYDNCLFPKKKINIAKILLCAFLLDDKLHEIAFIACHDQMRFLDRFGAHAVELEAGHLAAIVLIQCESEPLGQRNQIQLRILYS